MKRIALLAILACLFAWPALAATATWNPSDKNSPITLSNGNLTATSSGSGGGSVRSTTSFSTGKLCYEGVANTISPNWTIGLANATFNLGLPQGLGYDTNGIGIDPNSVGAKQGIFFNNTALFSGSTASASGDIFTICVDLSAKLFWATDVVMRTAGQVWNNAVIGSSNPATGTGGASFSAMSCPCFAIFNDGDVGVITLNTTGPFQVTTPSGFAAWSPLGTSSHPTFVIMGANQPKNTPHRQSQEVRYALSEQRRRSA